MSDLDRRSLIHGAFATSAMLGLAGGASAFAATRPKIAPELVAPELGAPELIATTASEYWKNDSASISRSPLRGFADMDVMLREDVTFQTVRGFGACFSELGWVALSALPAVHRNELLGELFAPGKGAGFTVCRLPIGANDFARNWYSYDETPGDFAMAHFSIDRDREMLTPFIKAAKAFQPDLKLWASPWSPPTWMKTNGHYASARPQSPSMPDNGLRPDQVVREGQDGFILEDRYLAAYALYFRRFIEAYRREGLNIGAVMPQNEFNSAQPFPSCLWTPEGLARFIPYLGREMQPLGVDVVFGTLERGDDRLFEKVFADPESGRYIKGVAAQWAGRRAIPFIHHNHPDLPVYQSEQECGDGANDWRYARYTFTLMRDFFNAGAEVYDYWNIALPKGAASSWGWNQNSLISVDMKTGESAFNPDYYVLKHLSHFVQPGAKRLDTLSILGFEDLLAFRNPDGRLVVAVRNAAASVQKLRIAARGQVYAVELKADSISTLVI